jgi:hypothetical protein
MQGLRLGQDPRRLVLCAETLLMRFPLRDVEHHTTSPVRSPIVVAGVQAALQPAHAAIRSDGLELEVAISTLLAGRADRGRDAISVARVRELRPSLAAGEPALG